MTLPPNLSGTYTQPLLASLYILYKLTNHSDWLALVPGFLLADWLLAEVVGVSEPEGQGSSILFCWLERQILHCRVPCVLPDILGT